jgi:hypothetical protein
MTNTTTKPTTFSDLIEAAMLKYPKARRIAVENFSSGYRTMSYEASANLRLDTGLYKWTTTTVAAIKWVINQRAKLGF